MDLNSWYPNKIPEKYVGHKITGQLPVGYIHKPELMANNSIKTHVVMPPTPINNCSLSSLFPKLFLLNSIKIIHKDKNPKSMMYQPELKLTAISMSLT
jgi:hypothetical protein